jgi:hypothetical protein
MSESLLSPDIRTDSLNTLGQILKVAEYVSPEAFPHKVALSRKSPFFQGAYARVYKKDAKIQIEHEGLVAVNDVGEIMISQTVFDGDSNTSLTDTSLLRYRDFSSRLRLATFPPGWRLIGSLHSHPEIDVLNFTSDRIKEAADPQYHPPSTFSFSDFLAFLAETKHYGHTMLGIITPVQLALLSTSRLLVELLSNPLKFSQVFKAALQTNPLRHVIHNSVKPIVYGSTGHEPLADILGSSTRPPYEAFSALGVVCYAGVYGDADDFELHRYS